MEFYWTNTNKNPLEIQLKFNRNFNEYQWKSNLDQSEALILAQIFGNNDYSQTELSRHVEFWLSDPATFSDTGPDGYL